MTGVHSSLLGRVAAGRTYVNEGTERTPKAGWRAVSGAIVAVSFSRDGFVVLVEEDGGRLTTLQPPWRLMPEAPS